MNMIEYTVKVFDSGNNYWYLKGRLHREDGPAVEYSDGTKRWYSNGLAHRKDGPAVQYCNGGKAWYINGQLHHEDGPAVIYSDGNKAWYLNDVEYSEEEFNKKINPKDCSGSTVIVDGVEYTLNRKS
jgi:hypothetical protein